MGLAALLNTLQLPERNYPSDAELLRMAKKFKTNFADTTFLEIDQAIDLVVEGKIDQDLNFYDKPFNRFMIAELMGKYKALQKDAITQFIKKTPPPPEPEPTKQEIYEDMRQDLINIWEAYKAGTGNLEALKWYFYTTVVKDAKLFVPTTQEIKEAQAAAIELLKAEMAAEHFKIKPDADQDNPIVKSNILSMVKSMRPNNVKIYDKSREVLLSRYFQRLKAQKLELTIPQKLAQ